MSRRGFNEVTESLGYKIESNFVAFENSVAKLDAFIKKVLSGIQSGVETTAKKAAEKSVLFSTWAESTAKSMKSISDRTKEQLSRDFFDMLALTSAKLKPVTKVISKFYEEIHSIANKMATTSKAIVSEQFGLMLENVSIASKKVRNKMQSEWNIFLLRYSDMLIPLVDTFSKAYSRVSQIVSGISEKFKEYGSAISDFFTTKVFTSIKKYAAIVPEYVGRVVDYLKKSKHSPLVEATIATAWNAAKLSVISFAGVALKTTNQVVKFTVKIMDWTAALTGYMRKAYIWVEKVLGAMSEGVEKGIHAINAGWEYIKEKADNISRFVGIKKIWEVGIKITGIAAAGVAITSLYRAATGRANAFSLLMGQIETLFAPVNFALYELTRDILPRFVNMLLPISEGIKSFIINITQGLNKTGAVSTSIDKVMTSIRKVATSLVDSLTKALGGIWMAIKGIFSGSNGQFIDKILKLVEKLSVFLGGVIKTLGKFIADLITKYGPVVIKFIEDAVGFLIDAGESLKVFLEPLFNYLIEEAPKFISLILGLVKSIWNFIEKLFPILKAAGKILLWIGEYIAGPILKALIWTLGAVFAVLGKAIGFITKIVTGLWELLKTIGAVFYLAYDVAKRPMMKLFNFISEVWGKMVEAFHLDEIWGTVKRFFTDIGEYIMGVFEPIGKFLSNFFDGIGYGIRKVGELLGLVDEEKKLERPKKKLASGGVVVTPTNALVAEKGPELVLPITKETITEVVSTIIQAVPVDIKFPSLVTIDDTKILKALLEVKKAVDNLQQQMNLKKSRMSVTPGFELTTDGF